METLLRLILTAGVFIWYPVAGALQVLSRLEKPLLSGPSAALEGSVEVFFCHMPLNPPNVSVLLKLYMEENLNKVIGEHIVNFEEQAVFPLVINEAYDRGFICEASGNNNTEIESTFSDSLKLKVISPVEGAAVVSHPSTDDLWEGQTLTLRCDITRGTHVSYDWLRNETSLHRGYGASVLILHSLSVRNTGDYKCVASNRLNDTMLFTSSSDVTSVRVKEYISKPKISLDVIKIGDGDFNAIIKCGADKETPPNTFSLLNDTRVIGTETTHSLQAFFNVSVKLNRDMGWVRCMARNHLNELLSEPMSLTVESVGGAVTMTPFKHVARDFEVFGNLHLRCKVERGTFPLYYWFLNNTRLVGRAAFHAVAGSDNSILSVSVGPDSSGFYRCEASDRFDNSTRISSRKMLINKEVLNRVSSSVLLVVFSCFILLMVTVSVCCIYGAVLRRRYSRKYLLTERCGETRVTSTHADEDEDDDYLMVMVFHEDVIHAEGMSNSHFEVFAIVVFASITAEGYVNTISEPDVKCVFNRNDGVCHYGVGIGVIAFLACAAFLLADAYLPLMSNAQERKYVVMADLGLSGSWTFLWFVCFCLTADQWSKTVDTQGIPTDAVHAVIAFSFFSIGSWGALTYFALVRFRQGVGDVTQNYPEPPPDHTSPYPSTYTPPTYPSFQNNQQPSFITPNPDPVGQSSYQPPTY